MEEDFSGDLNKVICGLWFLDFGLVSDGLPSEKV
jgi:hypothetical protein